MFISTEVFVNLEKAAGSTILKSFAMTIWKGEFAAGNTVVPKDIQMCVNIGLEAPKAAPEETRVNIYTTGSENYENPTSPGDDSGYDQDEVINLKTRTYASPFYGYVCTGDN